MRTKIMGKSYAVCAEHASLALDHMAKRNVNVRSHIGLTDEQRQGFTCSCGKVADYYLVEVEDDPTNG